LASTLRAFADRHTQQLYLTGRSRRFPAEIAKRAACKLEQVNAASRIEDLQMPPGNRLHALEGSRVGQHVVSVNDQ